MHRALKCRSLSIGRDLGTPPTRATTPCFRRRRRLRKGRPRSPCRLRAGTERKLQLSRTPTSDRRILHPRCTRFGSRSSRRTLVCRTWRACTRRRSSMPAPSKRETCRVTLLFAPRRYCAIGIAPCGCPFAADSLARGGAGSARIARGCDRPPSVLILPPCKRGQQWLPPPVNRSA